MISLGLLLLAAFAAASPESPCTITVYTPQVGQFAQQPQRPILLQDLFYGPINVLADISSGSSPTRENFNQNPNGKAYQAFYLRHGLRSLKEYKNLEPLYNYLKNSNALAGVVFYAGNLHNPSFFKNYVSDVVLTDSFSLHDYVTFHSRPFPILIISPQYEFISNDFRGVSDIGTFILGNASQEFDSGFNQGLGPGSNQGFGPGFNQGYGPQFNEAFGPSFYQASNPFEQRPSGFQQPGFPSQPLSNRFGGPLNEVSPVVLPRPPYNPFFPSAYPTLVVPIKEEDLPVTSSQNSQGSTSLPISISSNLSSDNMRVPDPRRQKNQEFQAN